MDPSIMKKLLEDDEDESMHSGADVDAFQAALNRDIAGDFSAPQPSGSESAFMAQGSNSASNQSVPMPQYQTANRDDSTNYQIQQDQSYSHARETNSSENELAEQPPNMENLQQKSNGNASQEVREDRQIREATGKNPNPGSESQYLKLQKMSNQQATVTEQANKPPMRNKQVPFGMLLPVLINQLDRDKGMQLNELFGKLKREEISKESFVRLIRGVVGEQMLRLAVHSVQSQMQGQQSDKNQAHQKGTTSSTDTSEIPSLKTQVQPNQAHQTLEKNADRMPFSNQERDSIQGLNKQQPLHFPPTPFSAYGVSGGNSHFYSGANPNTSTLPMKPQQHDSQMRQISQHQNMGSSQGANILAVKSERQNQTNDSSRMYGGPHPHFPGNSTNQQKPVPWQPSVNRDQNLPSMSYIKPEPLDQANEIHHRLPLPNSQGLPSVSAAQTEHGSVSSGISRDESTEKRHSIMGFSNNSSAATAPTSSVSSAMARQLDANTQVGSRAPSGTHSVNNNNNNDKTPPRKPVIGQKKPLEALGSSPPPASKKPKVGGTFLDQSIEQLNDVTAVSGVNLREEEEQLFSVPKEDSRVSEASRKAMQEEEERSLLQKNPLQKKLAEIMAKCGLKCINSDVERCLSLSVEERMRGLIDNLIRLSKQRVDAEKSRHQIITTSDVRLQIMAMNQKAKEEWDKKHAEAEKLRKQNEPESSSGVDGDKEKDDGRGKSVKTPANKEEDDKMRTTAANVAARAAVGGDDMLSKWQLMAEQAKQKREGGSDSGAGSHTGKDGSRNSTPGRTLKDHHDSDKQGFSAHGGAKKFGRNQGMVAQTRVVRRITVKDVVAVLEREPQMSKSTLIYRLYDKIRSDQTPE